MTTTTDIPVSIRGHIIVHEEVYEIPLFGEGEPAYPSNVSLRQVPGLWEEEKVPRKTTARQIATKATLGFTALSLLFIGISIFSFLSGHPASGVAALGPILASLVGIFAFYPRHKDKSSTSA